MTTSAPRLSGFRTFLLIGLAIVWLGEGLFTGLPQLAQGWTTFWKMLPPADPALATALYITHAFEAPLKGGLLVLALCALHSRDPAVRTPLLAAMSLVPPINIAFHFRAQGYPLVSMTIATTLSAILWGGILLTREAADPSPRQEARLQNIPGRMWFALAAAFLTFLGLLFLLAPTTALYWQFPCLTGTFDAHPDQLASLKVSILAAGSHLTALATATWFAAARFGSTPALRRAVTLASITTTALMCALPLRQVLRQGGWSCVGSPVLLPFTLLLAGWVTYAAISRSRGNL